MPVIFTETVYTIRKVVCVCCWKHVSQMKYFSHKFSFNIRFIICKFSYRSYYFCFYFSACESQSTLEKVILGPSTLSRVNDEQIKEFVQCCQNKNVLIYSSVSIRRWLQWQQNRSIVIPAIVTTISLQGQKKFLRIPPLTHFLFFFSVKENPFFILPYKMTILVW